jgi:hypothetical protein
MSENQEQSETKTESQTERKPTNRELLQEALSFIDETKVILQQREVRALRRHDNIKHNLSETVGKKKHRVTAILLGYLRTETFDSIILLEQMQELFDMTAVLLERSFQQPEQSAKEVAPEIMKLLEKGQKLRQSDEQEDDEGPRGPDTRLFT